MPLSPSDRGVFEKIIDDAINRAKYVVKMYSNEKTKRSFHITNVPDFAFGWIYNDINSKSTSIFFDIHERNMTTSEIKESAAIVLRRLPEIRKAIFYDV